MKPFEEAMKEFRGQYLWELEHQEEIEQFKAWQKACKETEAELKRHYEATGKLDRDLAEKLVELEISEPIL